MTLLQHMVENGMKCPLCGLPSVGRSKYCPSHRKQARKAFLEKIRDDKDFSSRRAIFYKEIYDKAFQAGHEAAKRCIPNPMVVEQHESPLDDSSPVSKQWVVPSGVCGFAWVVVKPGTSSFARWLSKNGIARKHYYGGVSIWISHYNQSMELKEAHARAMSLSLQESLSSGEFADPKVKVYSGSRMD